MIPRRETWCSGCVKAVAGARRAARGHNRPVIGPTGSAALRLAGLLTALGLVTSRLGLLAHELVGHGATAVALGGRVIEVRLFWFAGGWIRYRLEDAGDGAAIAVASGGIIVEAVIGALLWSALRRGAGVAARLSRGIGAALVIHAAWYLAAGTWHGFGDGVILRRELGDARVPVALAAGAAAIAMAYLGARAVLGVLAAMVPGGRAARIGGAAAAIILAGGLQLALAAGEVQLRRDETYGRIMRRERDRLVERELAEWQRGLRERGIEASQDEARRRARELAERHRELPFAHVLGALTLIAIGAGAWRARGGPAPPVRGRLLGVTTAAAAASVLLVIALDAMLV
jgi:hypothetical protein